MRSMPHATVFLLIYAMLANTIWPAALQAEDFTQVVGRLFRKPADAVFRRNKPQAPKNRSVEELAKQIDWLEHHIETFGTIVPKQPDVWGESRLTKHRQEYEREIAKLVNKEEFKATINGAIQRSDQSLLALAFSLDAAGEGGTIPTTNNAMTMISGADIEDRTGENPVDLKRFDNEMEDKISLEPTILADQMSRYLKHINHLRRINEGDDTADSPGYAINLVRIPVSLLPGKRTQAGYGAEITVTAKAHLTEELLPATFENLVINDIVDQLGLIITKAIENDDTVAGTARTLRIFHAVNWDKRTIDEGALSDTDKTSEEFKRIKEYLNRPLKLRAQKLETLRALDKVFKDKSRQPEKNTPKALKDKVLQYQQHYGRTNLKQVDRRLLRLYDFHNKPNCMVLRKLATLAGYGP